MADFHEIRYEGCNTGGHPEATFYNYYPYSEQSEQHYHNWI
jgi:hypothetical protein